MGEAFSVTGEDAEFSLTNADGSLVLLGGNGATMRRRVLRSTVSWKRRRARRFDAMTTLINKLVEGGEDQVVAQAKVKSAFGITAAEI